MKFCKDCEKFIGGGDWNLCCKEPHPEAVFGFLCYEDTPACELFEEKKMLKLWIDDIRQAPDGYIWIKGANEALRFIMSHASEIELIDLDHDAGDYYKCGGDYIAILNELERKSRQVNYVNGVPFHNYWHLRCQEIKFRIHSANVVGVQNMRAIIQRNGWKEIR